MFPTILSEKDVNLLLYVEDNLKNFDKVVTDRLTADKFSDAKTIIHFLRDRFIDFYGHYEHKSVMRLIKNVDINFTTLVLWDNLNVLHHFLKAEDLSEVENLNINIILKSGLKFEWTNEINCKNSEKPICLSEIVPLYKSELLNTNTQVKKIFNYCIFQLIWHKDNIELLSIIEAVAGKPIRDSYLRMFFQSKFFIFLDYDTLPEFFKTATFLEVLFYNFHNLDDKQLKILLYAMEDLDFVDYFPHYFYCLYELCDMTRGKEKNSKMMDAD